MVNCVAPVFHALIAPVFSTSWQLVSTYKFYLLILIGFGIGRYLYSINDGRRITVFAGAHYEVLDENSEGEF